jgi:hypothetical protein
MKQRKRDSKTKAAIVLHGFLIYLSKSVALVAMDGTSILSAADRCPVPSPSPETRL